jgi:putative transposase
MCTHFNVTRAGFYAWCQRAQSARAVQDQALFEQVRKIHQSSGKIYGAPRVRAGLRERGLFLGQRRVARLMRTSGLVGRSARIYRHSRTGSKAFFTSVPNRCKDLVPTEPNQLWVGDVTYLRVDGQWRYLAVVMDRFSRRIVGWSLSKRRDAALTTTALRYAARRRDLSGTVIFHSDRGIEYAAHEYKAAIAKLQITQSMNRPGKMNDNAHMESFFHSLKCEFLFGKIFHTDGELRKALTHYMPFYNQQRLHSSLGYLSPQNFEIIHAQQSCVN